MEAVFNVNSEQSGTEAVTMTDGSDEAKVKEPSVTCHYCCLRRHLRIVHFIIKNLDDLVEFTFNSIHGGPEGTTLLYYANIFPGNNKHI